MVEVAWATVKMECLLTETEKECWVGIVRRSFFRQVWNAYVTFK